MEINFKKTIFSKRFAHLLGYFAADGSFYKDLSGTRFEFTDGTSVESELDYSKQFFIKIQKYLEIILDKKLPTIRKKGNKYVLSFRSKDFEKVFLQIGFRPGNKTKTVTIPKFYKNTKFEQDFWIGVMDGDGMVARNSRKISLESISKQLIVDFKEFLDRNKVEYTYRERFIKNQIYQVFIKSAQFREFSKLIMFSHPRKYLWMQEHLKKEFYRQNNFAMEKFLLNDNIIDYFKIFKNKNIFIVNGVNLINMHRKRKNVPLFEIYTRLTRNNQRIDILKILADYRFKASKGTNKSIKLPLALSDELKQIMKYVRIRDGSISYSKKYIESYNESVDKITTLTKNLFDLEPSITTKKEVIFCSTVLSLLFSKIQIK